MQHSVFSCVNNRDMCAVKAGPQWTSSMAYLQQQLTDGAGFPPFAVQTRVKFWAWYRLNGAGVFSATTDMLFGGAVEDKKKAL